MIKKITIVISALWILLLTAWIALSVLLIVKADDIGKYLIMHINKVQSGELKVGNISVSPIKQFPHTSIILSNLEYFEHKESDRKQNEKPLGKVNNFYCGIELFKLIKNQLKVSSIVIEGGELDLVIYPDSSLNLINAVETKSEPTSEKKSISSKIKSEESDVFIVVDELKLVNVKLSVTNNPDNKQSAILIKDFQSDFEYRDKNLKFNFFTIILIESLKINDDLSISDQEIKIHVESRLDKVNGIQVEKGKLETDIAGFNFNGYFNPAEEGDLSVQVESDGSLNILSLFVKDEVIKNLKKGKFNLSGLIEGKVFSEFPLMDISFGLNNVELINPVTSNRISNLNIKGNFNSGKNKNLSQAILTVDTLYANSEMGAINFSGMMHNFTHPIFKVNLFLDADVTGADNIFKLTGIDSIKGRITIQDKSQGTYDSESKKIKSTENTSDIAFRDFGFVIPNTIRFDKINGHISRDEDEFILSDLKIISDNTDLNIDGKIKNIQYLLLDIDKEITADLKIKSKVFDLPNFLFFDPSIKRDFPHRILNLELIVDATTTTEKVLHFKSFPEILFDIKKMNATAEGFIPRIEIEAGKFKVSESLLGFHLDFNKFKTNFLDGSLNFSAQYNSSSFQPYFIKGDFEMDEIQISKILFTEKDSVPEFYQSKSSGSFSLELQFADDSTQIKLLNITRGNLVYSYSQDTIFASSLNFKSKNIDYRLNENSNPLATLYTMGTIKATEIRSHAYDLDNSDFAFSVTRGKYKIESINPKVFGDGTKGKIVYYLEPFLETPQFRIYCDITRFSIEEMLRTFLNDTTVTGDLSMSMDISAHGKKLEDMLSSLNGEINLHGKNLVFYGVDADKLIEEFQRSQNFNLVDAGAVLLAGPVGLVVTKGTDFAKILITSPGKSSQIKEFISNWKVTNGSFLAEDVALSTQKNKVAAKGWINIATDSLNFSFAVINDQGCSIFRQDVFGDINKPTLGKVKVVSTLLAPVTNLYNDIMNVNCQVFYDGTLIHNKK